MSNYKDLSSEELKRTLAEKQDILRRTMKPDEYKKFMQELDDCQIKIDYSKFGKPVQYPETKKEKRQRKKEERILSKASREKPKILLFFCNRTHKNISSVSNNLYSCSYPYSFPCLADLQVDFCG